MQYKILEGQNFDKAVQTENWQIKVVEVLKMYVIFAGRLEYKAKLFTVYHIAGYFP